MKIHIAAMGSRGDVQPLLALGLGLHHAGHDVAIACADDYAGMVSEAGLTHLPTGVRFSDLITSDLGMAWMGDSSHHGGVEMKRAKEASNTWGRRFFHNVTDWTGYDIYVSGVLSFSAIDALAQVAGGQHVFAQLSPLTPTASARSGLQPLFPGRSNALNFAWAEAALWVIGDTVRGPAMEARARLGLREAISANRGRRIAKKTRSLGGYSAHVVPPAADWPRHFTQTGFWFMDQPQWQPHDDLAEFIEAGEAPVFVGFGSMPTPDPDATMAMILEAVGDRRALVQRGNARLEASDLPANVHLAEAVPHDWLFPRCSAVIHHGGAGTTGAGLRAGVPTGIIGHIADQYYWGRRVEELGVGAAMLKRFELTVFNLRSMIDSLDDVDMRQRAAALGERIREEDGVARAVKELENQLGA